jgi:hypothetical protein
VVSTTAWSGDEPDHGELDHALQRYSVVSDLLHELGIATERLARSPKDAAASSESGMHLLGLWVLVRRMAPPGETGGHCRSADPLGVRIDALFAAAAIGTQRPRSGAPQRTLRPVDLIAARPSTASAPRGLRRLGVLGERRG